MYWCINASLPHFWEGSWTRPLHNYSTCNTRVVIFGGILPILKTRRWGICRERLWIPFGLWCLRYMASLVPPPPPASKKERKRGKKMCVCTHACIHSHICTYIYELFDASITQSDKKIMKKNVLLRKYYDYEKLQKHSIAENDGAFI